MQHFALIIQEVMELLDIEDKAKHYPYELSGGQKQRVAIARAIVAEPDIIIADELTGALDEETGKKIMDIFENIHRQGTTIIMVTHDKDLGKLGTKNISMRDGMICAER